eukprot:TRINITY_DN2957_c0_g2_i1.p1 TRINITY_DN2957_c0_g2~~TRINITY_DN2957_c0_g2_i1.p1  ORF type:complete len:682 (+),score=87.89 TRINITY_DN2957_c0_g2_i1:718-2763(+)
MDDSSIFRYLKKFSSNVGIGRIAINNILKDRLIWGTGVSEAYKILGLEDHCSSEEAWKSFILLTMRTNKVILGWDDFVPEKKQKTFPNLFPHNEQWSQWGSTKLDSGKLAIKDRIAGTGTDLFGGILITISQLIGLDASQGIPSVLTSTRIRAMNDLLNMDKKITPNDSRLKVYRKFTANMPFNLQVLQEIFSYFKHPIDTGRIFGHPCFQSMDDGRIGIFFNAFVRPLFGSLLKTEKDLSKDELLLEIANKEDYCLHQIGTWADSVVKLSFHRYDKTDMVKQICYHFSVHNGWFFPKNRKDMDLFEWGLSSLQKDFAVSRTEVASAYKINEVFVRDAIQRYFSVNLGYIPGNPNEDLVYQCLGGLGSLKKRAEEALCRFYQRNGGRQLGQVFPEALKNSGIKESSWVWTTKIQSIESSGRLEELSNGKISGEEAVKLFHLSQERSKQVLPPTFFGCDVVTPLSNGGNIYSEAKNWDKYLTPMSFYRQCAPRIDFASMCYKPNAYKEEHASSLTILKEGGLWKKSVRVVMSINGFSDDLKNQIQRYNEKFQGSDKYSPVILFYPKATEIGDNLFGSFQAKLSEKVGGQTGGLPGSNAKSRIPLEKLEFNDEPLQKIFYEEKIKKKLKAEEMDKAEETMELGEPDEESMELEMGSDSDEIREIFDFNFGAKKRKRKEKPLVI